MPLTDIKIRSAKAGDKAYKLFDSGGLYLEVSPGGSKYWHWKYRFGGKQKRLAFGVYPDVSLREARYRPQTNRFWDRSRGSPESRKNSAGRRGEF